MVLGKFKNRKLVMAEEGCYQIYGPCKSCENRILVNIKHGTTVKDHFEKIKSVKCPECDVENLYSDIKAAEEDTKEEVIVEVENKIKEVKLENFEWNVNHKPSETLYSLMQSLNKEKRLSQDQLNGFAFAIGQVCALEITSSLKFKSLTTTPHRLEGKDETK